MVRSPTFTLDFCRRFQSKDCRPYNSSMVDDKSVRWRCRRGMKEMDVLLERFLDRGYAKLDEHECDVFARLLDQKDPDLLDLLTGRAQTSNPEFSALIERMRPFLSSSP